MAGLPSGGGDGAVRKPIVEASAVVRFRSATADVPNAVRSGLAHQETAVNESAAIDVWRSYVEAQFDYFRSNPNADGVLAFAQKIRSTPGKHDGLYWSMTGAEAESPLGPNVAAAAIAEQQPKDRARLFSGYCLKMLRAQGPAASGGARNSFAGGAQDLGLHTSRIV